MKYNLPRKRSRRLKPAAKKRKLPTLEEVCNDHRRFSKFGEPRAHMLPLQMSTSFALCGRQWAQLGNAANPEICLVKVDSPDDRRNAQRIQKLWSGQDRWISVEDGTPPKGQTVLVYVPFFEKRPNSRTVCMGHYIPCLNSWHIDGSPSDWDVSHWQFLPSKPDELS